MCLRQVLNRRRRNRIHLVRWLQRGFVFVGLWRGGFECLRKLRRRFVCVSVRLVEVHELRGWVLFSRRGSFRVCKLWCRHLFVHHRGLRLDNVCWLRRRHLLDRSRFGAAVELRRLSRGHLLDVNRRLSFSCML